MGDPAVVESWHLPRALSDEALRLLTSLPMEEIERRLLAPIPAPIPVSERLPGLDELCWWFKEDEEEERYGCSWTLLRIVGNTGPYTHWLTAHALPLPERDQ